MNLLHQMDRNFLCTSYFLWIFEFDIFPAIFQLLLYVKEFCSTKWTVVCQTILHHQMDRNLRHTVFVIQILPGEKKFFTWWYKITQILPISRNFLVNSCTFFSQLPIKNTGEVHYIITFENLKLPKSQVWMAFAYCKSWM